MTDAWDRSGCTVAGTLAVVGEKWSLLVIREAFLGTRRFAEFQQRLGAPKAVLTDRLGTLVHTGVLTRVPYQAAGERQRHEYRLTEKGIDLYPVVVALLSWGARYLTEDGLAPLQLQHKDCGADVRLVLECADGHPVAGAREVRAVLREPAESAK